MKWIREAASELVDVNSDRGRNYDNSPDVEETMEIIAKHFAKAKVLATTYEPVGDSAAPSVARTDFCKVCGIPRYIHDHPAFIGDHGWLSPNTGAEAAPSQPHRKQRFGATSYDTGTTPFPEGYYDGPVPKCPSQPQERTERDHRPAILTCTCDPKGRGTDRECPAHGDTRKAAPSVQPEPRK